MTVFPRCNVDCIPPLPLACTNDGPGHYDALIPAEHTPSEISAASDGSVEKRSDKTVSVSPNKNTKLKCKKRNYCRCGINRKRECTKKGNAPRKYKNRCACVNYFSKYSRNCRCKGSCGGTACKDEATTQDSFKKRS